MIISVVAACRSATEMMPRPAHRQHCLLREIPLGYATPTPTFVRPQLISNHQPHHHHSTIKAFPQSMSSINISGNQFSEVSN